MRATAPLARSSTVSTIPTRTRPSDPISRCSSGSGTLDEVELRDGFPKSADELYRYHAIILDDLEAAFFTHDQLAPVRGTSSASAAVGS